MKTTLKDIARECGVSIGTVSDILNRKGNFKDETRDKVYTTVRRLNYKGSARMPGGSGDTAGARTIGLVIPSAEAENDTFFSRGVAGAKAAASASGYNFSLFSEDEIIAVLSGEAQSGSGHIGCRALVIMAPHHDWDRYLPELKKRGIAAALAYRETAVPCVPSVALDDYAGTKLALGHLSGLGHRRIGFIRRTTRLEMVERGRAYRDFLASAGLVFDENLVADTARHDHDTFHAWLSGLMRAGDRPTAFFCEADDLAIGMCKWMYNNGYRVPHDVAVVGFDDNLIAEKFSPGITTVRNPVREIIGLAVDLVAGGLDPALEGKYPIAGSTIRYTLSCSLVVRQSCGAKTDIDIKGGVI